MSLYIVKFWKEEHEEFNYEFTFENSLDEELMKHELINDLYWKWIVSYSPGYNICKKEDFKWEGIEEILIKANGKYNRNDNIRNIINYFILEEDINKFDNIISSINKVKLKDSNKIKFKNKWI